MPANMPWDQADLAIQHSAAQWAAWGVLCRMAARCRTKILTASLLLPMGRFGPSFLVFAISRPI